MRMVKADGSDTAVAPIAGRLEGTGPAPFEELVLRGFGCLVLGAWVSLAAAIGLFAAGFFGDLLGGSIVFVTVAGVVVGLALGAWRIMARRVDSGDLDAQAHAATARPGTGIHRSVIGAISGIAAASPAAIVLAVVLVGGIDVTALCASLVTAGGLVGLTLSPRLRADAAGIPTTIAFAATMPAAALAMLSLHWASGRWTGGTFVEAAGAWFSATALDLVSLWLPGIAVCLPVAWVWRRLGRRLLGHGASATDRC